MSIVEYSKPKPLVLPTHYSVYSQIFSDTEWVDTQHVFALTMPLSVLPLTPTRNLAALGLFVMCMYILYTYIQYALEHLLSI